MGIDARAQLASAVRAARPQPRAAPAGSPRSASSAARSTYLLPEGGSNELAARGCAELPAGIEMDFDIICCPCGTGGTLAGIAAGLKPGQQAIGFSALKGAGFLTREVAGLQMRAFGQRSGNWRVEHGAHFGGFARRNADSMRSSQTSAPGTTSPWTGSTG